jgi:hypothetical protein
MGETAEEELLNEYGFHCLSPLCSVLERVVQLSVLSA